MSYGKHSLLIGFGLGALIISPAANARDTTPGPLPPAIAKASIANIAAEQAGRRTPGKVVAMGQQHKQRLLDVPVAITSVDAEGVTIQNSNRVPSLGRAAASQAPALRPAARRFDRVRVSDDIRILSSDAFEGRAVGSEGERRTIDFIIKRMRLIGLLPGGEIIRGRRQWTQRVPLVRSKLEGPIVATIETRQHAISITQGEQIAVRPPLDGSADIALDRVPLIFSGYGISAPEKHWDDFAGIDVTGKVILVLVNDPDFESGVGDFEGKTMTYYGRYLYKFSKAARRGAAGVLVVHEDGPAGYGWPTVRTSSLAAATDIMRADPKRAHRMVEGWMTHDQAAAIFAAAGRDFAAEKQAAQRRGFRPYDLNATLSIAANAKIERIVSHNVIGRIPGVGRAGELLMFGAHWDQDGIGDPDRDGDRVNHGALDNASGVAMILELARAWRLDKSSSRTVMFMATTDEERGMLGAEYYTAHPLYPLERTMALFHLDT